MSDDIGEWLDQLGLGEYAEAFAENQIVVDVLPRLTNDDLYDVGVKAVGQPLAATEILGKERLHPGSSVSGGFGVIFHSMAQVLTIRHVDVE